MKLVVFHLAILALCLLEVESHGKTRSGPVYVDVDKPGYDCDRGACTEGEGDCDKDSDCAANLVCGNANCQWGEHSDCCFDRKDAQCKVVKDGKCFKKEWCSVGFVVGTGKGYDDTKIGYQTGKRCISACAERRRSNPRVNGVTVYRNGNRGCWCEIQMTHIYSSKKYQSCFLDTMSERCHLPKNEGSCNDYGKKYYYNKSKNSCEAFIYGGCNGNDNRFDSEKDCYHHCKPDSFDEIKGAKYQKAFQKIADMILYGEEI